MEIDKFSSNAKHPSTKINPVNEENFNSLHDFMILFIYTGISRQIILRKIDLLFIYHLKTLKLWEF